MSRRANAHLRCPTCRMHGSLCVCALIPSLPTRTRLVLVIHFYEARKPSNTGRLASLCLPNSEMVVRGREGDPATSLTTDPSRQPVLLFPHEDAVPLTSFVGSPRPVTLIVPDGTWRQASKVRKRVAGLADIPCVSLPRDAPSVYRLRTEAHGHGLATLEAIARAMGILEGAEVRTRMEYVFRAMVERTLWARGELDPSRVTGGVPDGAERHDPTSGLARSGDVVPHAQ